MKRHTQFIKALAILITLSFLGQEVAWAAPGLSSVEARRAAPLHENPTLFEPPIDFADLKEIHRGDKDIFIIHIQDAHSNLSGQENLAGALDRIMSQYGVQLVLSEGGAEDCSLTPLKKIASPEVWKRVAKSYLVQGKLTGEEYLNLTTDHPMKIIGIEDILLYVKSVEHYGELADKREETLEYLKVIQRSVEKLKGKLYPRELVEYEKAVDSRQYSVDGENVNFEKRFEALTVIARSPAMTLRVNSATKSFDKLRMVSEVEPQSEPEERLLRASGARNDGDGYPNLQKLSGLKSKESQINFEAANLEQAVLVEEVARRGGEEDLDQFLKKASQAKNKRWSQFAYFQNIVAKAHEKSIDISQYENLKRYGDYLKDFSEIDLDAVLEEMERLEDEIYVDVIARSAATKSFDKLRMVSEVEPQSEPEERLLRASGARNDGVQDALLVRSIDRYLGLLFTAYKIQMTTKEFELFQTNEPDFTTVSYLAFINRKLAEQGYFEDLIPYKNTLEEGKKALTEFYDSVAKRDDAFLANTEKALQEENQKVAFLISGGYHTQHLKELFKERGYSYAVLTPIVTSETNQARYEKLLLSPIRPDVKKIETTQGESKSRNKSLGIVEKEGVRPLLSRMKGLDGSSVETIAVAAARLASTNSDEAKSFAQGLEIPVSVGAKLLPSTRAPPAQAIGARLAEASFSDVIDTAKSLHQAYLEMRAGIQALRKDPEKEAVAVRKPDSIRSSIHRFREALGKVADQHGTILRWLSLGLAAMLERAEDSLFRDGIVVMAAVSLDFKNLNKWGIGDLVRDHLVEHLKQIRWSEEEAEQVVTHDVDYHGDAVFMLLKIPPGQASPTRSEFAAKIEEKIGKTRDDILKHPDFQRLVQAKRGAGALSDFEQQVQGLSFYVSQAKIELNQKLTVFNPIESLLSDPSKESERDSLLHGDFTKENWEIVGLSADRWHDFFAHPKQIEHATLENQNLYYKSYDEFLSKRREVLFQTVSYLVAQAKRMQEEGNEEAVRALREPTSRLFEILLHDAYHKLQERKEILAKLAGAPQDGSTWDSLRGIVFEKAKVGNLFVFDDETARNQLKSALELHARRDPRLTAYYYKTLQDARGNAPSVYGYHVDDEESLSKEIANRRARLPRRIRIHHYAMEAYDALIAQFSRLETELEGPNPSVKPWGLVEGAYNNYFSHWLRASILAYRDPRLPEVVRYSALHDVWMADVNQKTDVLKELLRQFLAELKESPLRKRVEEIEKLVTPGSITGGRPIGDENWFFTRNEEGKHFTGFSEQTGMRDHNVTYQPDSRDSFMQELKLGMGEMARKWVGNSQESIVSVFREGLNPIIDDTRARFGYGAAPHTMKHFPSAVELGERMPVYLMEKEPYVYPGELFLLSSVQEVFNLSLGENAQGLPEKVDTKDPVLNYKTIQKYGERIQTFLRAAGVVGPEIDFEYYKDSKEFYGLMEQLETAAGPAKEKTRQLARREGFLPGQKPQDYEKIPYVWFLKDLQGSRLAFDSDPEGGFEYQTFEAARLAAANVTYPQKSDWTKDRDIDGIVRGLVSRRSAEQEYASLSPEEFSKKIENTLFQVLAEEQMPPRDVPDAAREIAFFIDLLVQNNWPNLTDQDWRQSLDAFEKIRPWLRRLPASATVTTELPAQGIINMIGGLVAHGHRYEEVDRKEFESFARAQFPLMGHLTAEEADWVLDIVQKLTRQLPGDIQRNLNEETLNRWVSAYFKSYLFLEDRLEDGSIKLHFLAQGGENSVFTMNTQSHLVRSFLNPDGMLVKFAHLFEFEQLGEYTDGLSGEKFPAKTVEEILVLIGKYEKRMARLDEYDPNGLIPNHVVGVIDVDRIVQYTEGRKPSFFKTDLYVMTLQEKVLSMEEHRRNEIFRARILKTYAEIAKDREWPVSAGIDPGRIPEVTRALNLNIDDSLRAREILSTDEGWKEILGGPRPLKRWEGAAESIDEQTKKRVKIGIDLMVRSGQNALGTSHYNSDLKSENLSQNGKPYDHLLRDLSSAPLGQVSIFFQESIANTFFQEVNHLILLASEQGLSDKTVYVEMYFDSIYRTILDSQSGQAAPVMPVPNLLRESLRRARGLDPIQDEKDRREFTNILYDIFLELANNYEKLLGESTKSALARVAERHSEITKPVERERPGWIKRLLSPEKTTFDRLGDIQRGLDKNSEDLQRLREKLQRAENEKNMTQAQKIRVDVETLEKKDTTLKSQMGKVAIQLSEGIKKSGNPSDPQMQALQRYLDKIMAIAKGDSGAFQPRNHAVYAALSIHYDLSEASDSLEEWMGAVKQAAEWKKQERQKAARLERESDQRRADLQRRTAAERARQEEIRIKTEEKQREIEKQAADLILEIEKALRRATRFLEGEKVGIHNVYYDDDGIIVQRLQVSIDDYVEAAQDPEKAGWNMGFDEVWQNVGELMRLSSSIDVGRLIGQQKKDFILIRGSLSEMHGKVFNDKGDVDTQKVAALEFNRKLALETLAQFAPKKTPHLVAGARLDAPAELFKEKFGARLTEEIVDTPDRVADAAKDEDTLFVLAKLHASRSSILGRFFGFYFNQIQKNALVNFREEKRDVYVQFYKELGGPVVGEVLIPADIMERAKAKPVIVIGKEEARLVVGLDAPQTAASVENGFFRMGMEAARDARNGQPAVLRWKAPTSDAEFKLMLEIKQSVQTSFQNVYVQFVSKDGALAQGSDDISGIRESYRVVDIDLFSENTLREAEGEKSRVLFLESAVSDKQFIHALPYASTMIAAILVARLDSIESNDLARKFFHRLTGREFGQREFSLLTTPSVSKQAQYKNILIKRIAKIAIDQFLNFARIVARSVSAAA